LAAAQHSWLGGTNGYPGNWSMSVSTNLAAWSIIASNAIPRDPTGTNFWTDAEPTISRPLRFYRPCVEYILLKPA
jgi:hypothetical protein